MDSLYFHIPYCERKCLYCDFYSIESQSSLKKFLEALVVELTLAARDRSSKTITTIFFGGGTPSLLSPLDLEQILTLVRTYWTIDSSAEITVETNPGTVDREKLAAYRSLGVNRLSVGIQSFDEDELRFLSRIHDATQAVRCIEDARAAGFDNVSIDLIYSLPGQSIDQWLKSLKRGLELEPDHLSLYSLIVEENTPLARLVSDGQVMPNPVDTEADLYQITMEQLSAKQFEHYEVSSYARADHRCRHNLAYWRHQNYRGFGPSAHSFERRSGGQAKRWGNVPNISAYISQLSEGRIPISFEEDLNSTALVREAVFLGLRSEGIDVDRLKREFGFAMSAGNIKIISSLLEQGLLVSEGSTYRLTDKGFPLCDEIACRLMP